MSDTGHKGPYARCQMCTEEACKNINSFAPLQCDFHNPIYYLRAVRAVYW